MTARLVTGTGPGRRVRVRFDALTGPGAGDGLVAVVAGDDPRPGGTGPALPDPTTAVGVVRDAAAALREALSGGQLEVHFQPIVRVADRVVTGVEALVRWAHPSAGLLAPAQFLPEAAAAGLLPELSGHVLAVACAQAVRWPDWQVAVNLTAADLESPRVLTQVRTALATSGLPPTRLTLEITEETLVHDIPAALLLLEELRRDGIRIALDDFGTGYCSLLYLREFPVTDLKIDREFIAGLGRRRDDTAIVTSVLSLAASLELTVTAEGVTTATQLRQLRALGCPYAQGYLFARPQPAGQLDAAYPDPRSPTPTATRIPPPRPRPLRDLPAAARDPLTAEVARLHRRGASLRTVASRLNRAGWRTTRGRPWTETTVARLIADLTQPQPPPPPGS